MKFEGRCEHRLGAVVRDPVVGTTAVNLCRPILPNLWAFDYRGQTSLVTRAGWRGDGWILRQHASEICALFCFGMLREFGVFQSRTIAVWFYSGLLEFLSLRFITALLVASRQELVVP